ncbi:carboxypeptidase-like regulatory domain-containing protein [Chitinophaga horti]|uniref:Carboxypeptidase-like regulatory domain-containing protein n=1 Tax=Chitinophaga horti TaxID=2920382 RepID=A0ABY6IYI0_9BACT|nr:carboxypeptidase-like regulatory domain-containing protein [Chitinophaga horti]UYQ92308.1 carboxypeptidase-like regulatory domain-containing protein [Chitinophaga horti]
MKRTKLSMLAIAAVAFGAFAFKSFDGGAISGKVTPADGATEAWAVAGADTLKAAISDGAFSFSNAKAGTYTIIVDGKDPYKDATITDVKVEDGKATDLGDIKLEQ